MHKYFGDENAIGKYILLGNDNNPYEIDGILDNIPDNSHLQFDFLASFSSLPAKKRNEGWAQNIDIYTYILVKKGTDPEEFKSKYELFPMKYLGEVLAKMGMTIDQFKAKGNFLKYELQPLRDIHLHSSIYDQDVKTAGNLRFLIVLCVIGLLILIIGCFNFINLHTSMAISRIKEIGIKKIIGSTREKVIWQILAETYIQCIIALVIAVLLLMLARPMLNSFAEIVIEPSLFLKFIYAAYNFYNATVGDFFGRNISGVLFIKF